MNSLTDDALALIIERGRLDDQLITFRLINSRFYRLSPQIRFRKLVIDDIVLLSGKIQTLLAPTRAFSDGTHLRPGIDAIIKLLTYIARIGSWKTVRAIQFRQWTGYSMPTWIHRLMVALSQLFPKVTALDLTMSHNRSIALGADVLNTIPRFRFLHTLRLNQCVGAEFGRVLSRLHLRRLEIGGLNAPLMTADNGLLEELTLLSPDPLAFTDDIAYRVADVFPNLKVHKMADRFGGHSIMPADFERNGGYSGLKELRQSDCVDVYFEQFLDRPSQLSTTFPNLRRISLLKPFSFSPTNRQLEPALTAFLRLTSLSFRLTNENGRFFRTVLTSISTLKNLTIDLPFHSGVHLLEPDLTKENAPFRSRLKRLSIKGFGGLPLLAKFWYLCPNLARVQFEDESTITQEHFADFVNEKCNFDGPPKLDTLIMQCDVTVRLLHLLEQDGRLKKLVRLGMNMYSHVTTMDEIEMTDIAMKLLTAERLPALRRLDISFQNMGPPSTMIAQTVLDSFPRLRRLALHSLTYDSDQMAVLWQSLGNHVELEFVDVKFAVGTCQDFQPTYDTLDELLALPRFERMVDDHYVVPRLTVKIDCNGCHQLVDDLYQCGLLKLWVDIE